MGVSALRTLLLADYLPINSRGVTIAAASMWWPPKRAFDQLDFSLDVTAILEVGDALAQVSAVTSPSGGSADLRVMDLTASGAVITAWLDAGAPGLSYVVSLAAVTALCRTFSWAMSIEIVSDAVEIGVPLDLPLPSRVAYSLIADTSGASIVDTAGNALLRTRTVWTDRMLSDTSGRSIVDTRGLPVLRSLPSH